MGKGTEQGGSLGCRVKEGKGAGNAGSEAAGTGPGAADPGGWRWHCVISVETGEDSHRQVGP
jgi:hypothetical protein